MRSQEYLNEMPWKALPFKDPREKELSTVRRSAYRKRRKLAIEFTSFHSIAILYSFRSINILILFNDNHQLFEVSGIPHLVILDENDKIITDNGRAAVSSDPEGNEFPWHPKPLEELGEVSESGLPRHLFL